MKCKIFLSSMGWGHIIRQLIIAKELVKKIPKLKLTIQGKKEIYLIKKFLKSNYTFIDDDNLIKFFHTNRGNIDFKKTKKYFSGYKKLSENWIDKNLEDKNYDFYLSDISPEGIKVASELNKPVFSVCHFTWDWFFQQFLPIIPDREIIQNWEKFQKLSTCFFFPPLTPDVILEKYKNHYKTPFLYANVKKKPLTLKKRGKVNILLMDSGDKLIKYEIKSLLLKYKNHKSFNFFHPIAFGNYKNTYSVKEDELLTDYINVVDLVIARPGFNTITSVLKSKKSSIYFLSKDNPETNWNIHKLHNYDLTHTVTIENLINNFEKIIFDKINFEKNIKKKIDNKNFKFDGHTFISKKIVNYLIKN